VTCRQARGDARGGDDESASNSVDCGVQRRIFRRSAPPFAAASAVVLAAAGF
jgi:hypothetical protein